MTTSISNKRKLLILGGPFFQIPVVQKAKDMGLYVGLIDINPKAPAATYADEFFIASITDYDAVFNIAKSFKPDGIIAGANDTPVVTVARLCEDLSLPGNTVDVALKSTDKYKMLVAFEQAGVPRPQYQFISNKDIDSFDLNINYPVISKPVDAASSRGVRLIDNEAELYSSIQYSAKAGISGDVLIEEYLMGPEVSVEVLAVEGEIYVLQITDKITSGPPSFTEIGHSQPSALPLKTKEAIKKVAIDAAKAIGLENTPAHIEIKVTPEGPKMVELGARLGSDCITTYLLDASVTGIDMVKASIMMALGEKADVSLYSNSGYYVAIRFIPAPSGKLVSVAGVNEVELMDGVVSVSIMAISGDIFNGMHNNSDRLGYIICKGHTTEEALNLCQNAIDKITIYVE